MYLMTPDEAAKKLKVATGTLRRWLRSGEFKAAKTPAGWRISEQDMNRFLAARHTGQPDSAEDAEDRAALGLVETGDFEDWNAVKTRNGL